MTDDARKPAGRQSLFRAIAITALILGLLYLVVAAHVRWLTTQTVCTGETTGSPDGRFVASIMDCFRRDYFTDTEHRWFEYRLEGAQISRSLNSDAIRGPYFGSRSAQKVIAWEADSSAVRFVFPNAELRFDTKPDAPF